MHSLKARNGTIFNFNSDFSGDVHITIPQTEPKISCEFKVNGNDILEFVAYHIQAEQITKIEQKSWPELLNLE